MMSKQRRAPESFCPFLPANVEVPAEEHPYLVSHGANDLEKAIIGKILRQTQAEEVTLEECYCYKSNKIINSNNMCSPNKGMTFSGKLFSQKHTKKI
jgi:hypothetical protein